MSGVSFKEARAVSNRDVVCLLQCAHPPGQPLRLWYYDGVLQEVQGEADNGVMSAVRKLLHFVYSDESEE